MRESSSVPRLLSGLTPPQRELVIEGAERRHCPAHQVIITIGDSATRLFQLTKGTAKFYRVTKKGNEVLLSWLGPEDIFGIGALLPGPWHYIATAQAVEDCDLLVWNREGIRALSPALLEHITTNALHVAMNFLAEYTDRVVDLTNENAEHRVARTLLQLARRTGNVGPDGVDVTITNEDLGSLANVSMFTTSRVMQKWEREGVIEKGRGKIRIFSPEHLFTD